MDRRTMNEEISQNQVETQALLEVNEIFVHAGEAIFIL